MKQKLTTITTVIALCSITSLASAAPRGAGHGKIGHIRRANIGNVAERIADKEEAILDHRDAHAWKKDPEARDHRPENLREYTTRTHRRIVRLLVIGALEEADGTKFKARHADIVRNAKAANGNGLDATERAVIRRKLDSLNDDINAAIVAREKGSKRTPIVNRAQHRFEQQIARGVKTGRLSTLEASSLRRKVARLEALEDRLKGGKELSSNERERLMKEVLEIKRDIARKLRD